MSEALFVILLVFGLLIGTISGGIRFYRHLLKQREQKKENKR